MSNQKRLDESVIDLRSQMGTLDDEDERTGHLRSLVDDVDRAAGGSVDAAAPANLEERIAVSMLHFEGSHPRIAMVLNEIAQKLSDMGI